MTPEQLREAAAVMLAAAEGKPLQVRCAEAGEISWRNIEAGSWNWDRFEYRIKPEPRKVKVQVFKSNDGSMLIAHVLDNENRPREWAVSDIVEIEVKDE